MEATQSHRPRTQQAKNTRDLIVKRWLELGRPLVDAALLADIQQQLVVRFGDDTTNSPASIARALADEGAELRHPEVIEFDAQWRESRVKSETIKFGEVEHLLSGGRLNLEQAQELIMKLEKVRQEFEREGDRAALNELKMLAVAVRLNAQSMAKKRAADESLRVEQAEIAEWLKVWLQTPSLFSDWLDLRRRSEEFRTNFVSRD